MESCNSEISKDDVYASFDVLRELGGDGGIKGRRIWYLMEVTKKNSTKCGDFLSLSDLFGYDAPTKLVEIMGRKWKNAFMFGSRCSGCCIPAQPSIAHKA